MRSLTCPEIDPLRVYHICSGCVRDPDLKRRLISIESQIFESADEFLRKAKEGRLYEVDRCALIAGVVTHEEMSKLYNQKMARKKAPARSIYDMLMMLPANGVCPHCALGVVSTLDHHLPKRHYAPLTVFPKNLVPACADCNKAKLGGFPVSEDTQTLHPYFDNVEGSQWLKAKVEKTFPAVIKYYVSPSGDFNEIMQKKIQHHFKIFKLSSLYSSHAAEELQGIKYSLGKLFAAGGASDVRSHLRERADSYKIHWKNSWKTAMYQSIAASSWFCSGGFR